MDVSEFDFELPPDLIAQEPSAERGASRLLYLRRDTGAITHRSIASLPDLLSAGDLLVVNNTRVFPARLLGRRLPGGGRAECLLMRRLETGIDHWEALVHPGQRLGPGARMVFEGSRTLHAEVLSRQFFGRRVVRLWTDDGSAVDEAVDAIGHVPLPPYIERPDRPQDRDRYQTVFARERGSVAAPTAGLHLTKSILAALAARGVVIVEMTLHVGYATFQPVRAHRVEAHRLDFEHYEISSHAADRLNAALAERRRIVAVGTTTTRALEAAARAGDGRIVAGAGSTDLFIHPGFEFLVIGGLMTNFHLPRYSLLMLVAAFAGLDQVLGAYRAAIAERYRFYSYGDAMLIL